MFEIGWSEILVIGIVALVVIGPKDLPRVLRTTGQMIGKLRRMAGDLQATFSEALREAERQAEIDDLKQKLSDANSTLQTLRDPLTPSSGAADPLKPMADPAPNATDALVPDPAAPAEAVPAEAVPAQAAPAEAVPAEAAPLEAAPIAAAPAGAPAVPPLPGGGEPLSLAQAAGGPPAAEPDKTPDGPAPAPADQLQGTGRASSTPGASA